MQVALYFVTSRTSGKSYVGITTGKVSHRWNKHVHKARSVPQYKFHHALAKYGPDDFELIELYSYPNLTDALHAEASVIANLDLTTSGYNTAANSDERGVSYGVTRSRETLARMAAAQRGKKQSAETVAKRLATRGPVRHTPDSRRKISEANKGRQFTTEHRERLSAAQRRRFGTLESTVTL